MNEITVCLQCMLEAMARRGSLDEPPQPTYVFVEPPAIHRHRLHPEPAVNEERRRELLAVLSDLANRA